MDQEQNDHLKAYGIAYYILTRNVNVEWILNYRGGSFLVDDNTFIQAECRIRGVSIVQISDEIIVKYGLYCPYWFQVNLYYDIITNQDIVILKHLILTN